MPHAKSCTFSKNTKFPKILNHVFKTSKKTLSYSRTYCKIYKIENIGKIGQSSPGIMAKRVIYYGSTRSTLGTPPSSERPPLFSRWILKSWKNPNYHFWGFLSQKRQKWHFWSLLTHHVNFVHRRFTFREVQSQNIPKCHFWTLFKTFAILQSYRGARIVKMSTLGTPLWIIQVPHFWRYPKLTTFVKIQRWFSLVAWSKILKISYLRWGHF